MSSYDNTKDLYLDREEEITNSSFTAKSQTEEVDKIIGPDAKEHRVLSADIQNATKSTIVGGKDVINATGQTLENASILGDAANLSVSTFTGGADKITLGSIDSGSAKVVGDALSANGGTTRGGNDTIIVEGDVQGTGGVASYAHIVGDVETISNTTFIAGNDNIQLQGNVSYANIYTDAKDYNGGNVLSGGNDTLTLGIAPTSAKPTVSTTVTHTDIYLGHGNNVLTAHSTLGEGTNIESEAGNDRFTFNTITGGAVNGGDGNDTFVITDVNGADVEITGRYGNDSFKITTFTNGEIDSGAEKDSITIGTMKDGAIDSGFDDDRITIDTMNGGKVNGFYGNERITIEIMNGGTVDGDDDSDTIAIDTMNGGTVDGDRSSDIITVKNMKGGTVDGGAFTDKVTITTMEAGAVEGGTDDDRLTVTTLKGGTVHGDNGDDSITITTMEAGTVNGNENDDVITISTMKGGAVDGGDADDSITISTVANGFVNGGFDDDKIHISKTATKSAISGNGGDDSITITTSTGSTIYGDSSSGEQGNDSIKITTAKDSTINGGEGQDSITLNSFSGSSHSGRVDGGVDNDTIAITTMTDASITDAGGNDSVKIGTIKGEENTINLGDGSDTLTINNFTANKANIVSENALDMGAGNDSLNILAKKTNYSDTDFAEALGAGHDTLNVNWAFNGAFDTSNGEGKTLITKGLGDNVRLHFGAGDDALIISGASSGNKSGLSDTELAESLGAGQDTLNVGWAFNGTFETSGDEGGTLITKGLHANSELIFGSGNNGLEVIGTLANRQITTFDGADTVSISSTATNVQVILGEGADVFSVGSMGQGSSLGYVTDGLDDITIKGTYNDGFVQALTLDAVNQFAGLFTGLSTGADGGSITLDTLGTGKLQFDAGADSLTINKNLAGTATVKKEISTFGGDDDIDLKGTVTNAIVDAGTGADAVSIGALSTGSLLTYDTDYLDSITLKGTYNTGFVQTTAASNIFYGLATGDDGGAITLDTLGTGKLQFGDGNDTLSINKALSGSLGLKDIFLQAGDDSVILNTVNGAVISGGDSKSIIIQGAPAIISSNDYISATGLGATGELRGDGGEDTLQIGRSGLDTVARPVTVTMSNGIMDGGADNDTIIIGNKYNDGTLYGTLSGGKVYGGSGNDTIETKTLSGSGLMDGGDGADAFTIVNMSGGTIEGGAGSNTVNITETFSRGTINGGADADSINISNFRGGTINGGLGNDSITIEDHLYGGTINSDGGADSIRLFNMHGGTINAGDDADSIRLANIHGGTINAGDAADSIYLEHLYGGTINLGHGDDKVTDGSGSYVGNLHGGTINGQDGDDSILLYTVNGGAVNGQDGNDALSIRYMRGGTVNAGEGDNSISIRDSFEGGSIIAGTGDDTLILENSINISGKYSINLGAGKNIIRVQSDLDGQELILGAVNDNVFLDVNVQNTKISLGNGNDTIITSNQDEPVTTTNTLIDTGAGNDSINLESAQDGTIIYAGAGDDRVILQNAYSAVVDLGTGNNYIQTAGTASNVVIIGGSGNDTVNISTNIAGDSFISTGTGNDSIKGNLIYDTGENSIHYDNKGLDTINLVEYRAGMVADAKGDITYVEGKGDDTVVKNFALSTGTDGGTIELDTWTSGEITLGNGHDSLFIGTNNSGTSDTEIADLLGKGNDTLNVGWKFNGVFDAGDDGGTLIATGLGDDAKLSFGKGNDGLLLESTLTKTVDFETGTDTISVSGFEGDGAVTYNNVGFDSISINGAYDGTGIEAQDGKLSTGTDGGYIHVESLSDANAAGQLSFSDKNDHFSIETMGVSATINLQKGNDTVSVGEITAGIIDAGTGVDSIEVTTLTSGTIKYDSVGYDSITVNGVYAGTGIIGYTTVKGVETPAGLTTGTDGGYIHVDSLTVNGADGLQFDKGHDHFSIDTMNVTGKTIDLDAGNDTVTINNSLTAGTLSGGAGTNAYNIENIAGGEVLGGTGVDKFDIASMSAGSVNGNAGNDTFTIGTFGNNSGNAKLSAGKGNDSISIDRIHSSNNLISAYGDEDVGSADTRGDVINGADRFIIDSVEAHVSIVGDNKEIASDADLVRGGNDTFIVEGDLSGRQEWYAKIIGDIETIGTSDNPSDVSYVAGNDNIVIKGNVERAELFTDSQNLHVSTKVSGGNDTVILGVKGEEGQTSVTYTNISLGHGNDALTAYSTLGTGTFINGNDGNDRFTIAEMTDNASISGDAGNDTFKITEMTGGLLHAGTGVDSITVTAVHGTTASSLTPTANIDGGEGNDTITVTTITGGKVAGGDGNDRIDITTVQGTSSSLAVPSVIINGDAGNDHITAANLTGGTIYGGTSLIDTKGKHGVDSIVIKNASNSTIYGDLNSSTTNDDFSYNDIIKVTGIAETTFVHGGYGNDNISVATLYDSVVYGEDGDDTITITTARGGGVLSAGASGGAGDDKITVTTGIGDDYDDGFSIDGGDGNDTIIMTTLNRGSVMGGLGADSIAIKNAYASTVFAGSPFAGEGSSIAITGLAENTDIYGSDGVTSGGLEVAHGNDTINVTKATAGSAIDGRAGDDSITIGTATSGSIDGGSGDDSIVVATVNSSTISGGDGADTIKVTTLTNSTIEGGAGEDYIAVNNQIKGVATFNNSAGIDEINMQAGIRAGAVINLKGAGGFIVDGDGPSLSDVFFNMSGGELNGSEGDDYFYVNTLSGGTIHGGIGGADGTGGKEEIRIKTMSGGVVDGGSGDDVIVVNSTMTNGEIYGGAGNDSIDVKINGASKGTLYGGDGEDTFIINSSTTKATSITIDSFDAVDDTLIIAGDTINAADFVGQESYYHEDSNITVKFTRLDMQGTEFTRDDINGISIFGTDGADTITISGTASNSIIYGRAEADTITVKTLTNSEIYGEEGADSISVATVTNGEIYGEEGADSISVTTVNGGRIDGGASADSITIINQVKKAITIANEAGQDSLYLENGIGSGGNVCLERGNFVVAASVDATDASNPVYTGFDLVSGTFTGSDGVETVYINTMSSGSLNTLNGTDTVNIHSMNGGTVSTGEGVADITITNAITKTVSFNNLGADADKLTLEGGLNGGTIKLGGEGGFTLLGTEGDDGSRLTMLKGTISGSTGKDSISIDTMTSGTINGGDGSDSVDVGTMQAGSINGGLGEDTITIDTFTGGTIDGGAGQDTIVINNIATGAKTVSIKNTGTEQDLLFLSNGIGEDVNVTLSSSAGFGVLGSKSGGFDMSGGKLTASNGVDIIYIDNMTGGTVLGGAGNDNIVVFNNTSGSIDAGSGNDLVAVASVEGMNINGGSGIDTLYIATVVDTGTSIVDLKENSKGFESFAFQEMTSGSVDGTDTADEILVDNMDGGAFKGDGGNDTLSVRNLSMGTVDGGEGNDAIHIDRLQGDGATVDGGLGKDTVYLDSLENEIIITNSGMEVDTLDLGGLGFGGTVNLTGNNAFVVNIDSIRSTSTVNATGAADTITITSMNIGTVNGGAGDDSITVLKATGGTVDGGAGMDAITMTTMNDGTIHGGADNDSIIITNMSGGTINGDAGADAITITSMSDGNINGGDGADVITITNMTDGTIKGDAGDDTITINLGESTSIAPNAVFGGDGADRFEITKSDTIIGEESLGIYDFDTAENDTIFIGGRDATADVSDALENGANSYNDTNTGIVIYFVS